MAYLHSLVKMEADGKIGWFAPAELGEEAPHYISFVIPLAASGDFFSEYSCETITAENETRRVASHTVFKRGSDAFVLRIDKLDVWFVVRTVPKTERRLQYIGKLRHEDFAARFTEIEPADPERLDKLFDESSTYIIGCEPYTHYTGINGASKQR